MVKKSLRKGIGRRLLYWDKLTTLLTEVEAIINTCPLTYIYEEFNLIMLAVLIRYNMLTHFKRAFKNCMLAKFQRKYIRMSFSLYFLHLLQMS